MSVLHLLHGWSDRDETTGQLRRRSTGPHHSAIVQPSAAPVNVCGRYGCHTIFHEDDGFETDGEDRGFPHLSAPPTTVVRRGPQSGNDLRDPSTGTRAPQNP